MRRLALPAGLLFTTLALASCAPASIDASPEPVIHGTRETGHPEVVAVYWADVASMNGGLCSGTVIGPHAILTAKHCVFQEPAVRGGAYVAVPPGWFYIIEGDNIETAGNPIHRVSEVRTTPGTDVDADVSDGSDIAILLTPDTLAVTPRGYATHSPATGSAATVVGFGRTITGTPMATDSGLKYSGPMMIRIVRSTQILANGTAWTCQGDSGGPLIDSEGNVCGITSFGFDSTCRDSNSVFTNVSAWTALITDALSWAPPCMPHGEVCNGIDDDCDGTVDDGLGCAPLGAPCAMDSECASTQCGMVGASMICTRGCFPDTMIDPCPVGTHCAVTGCGGGACAPGAPGTGAAGETCASDTDCASGYCAALQGRHLCARQCWPAGGSGCGAGLACNLGSASDPYPECGGCVPEAQAMGPRPIGGACTTDADCESMHCAAGRFYCTDPCTTDADCPGDWHCNGAFCAPGGLSQLGGACTTAGDCAASAPDCVEGACSIPCTMGTTDCGLGFACYSTAMGDHCLHEGAALGEPCATNPDCRSNQCLSINVCTQICDTLACPSGFSCVDAGGTHVCVAASAPPPSSCGCRAQRARAPWSALIGLGALGAWIVRRRRARG